MRKNYTEVKLYVPLTTTRHEQNPPRTFDILSKEIGQSVLIVGDEYNGNIRGQEYQQIDHNEGTNL